MPVTAGFPPITGRGARVLVLGTLPSQKSLVKNQYYGHPQNSFWPIMGALFDAGLDKPYSDRTKLIIQNHLAIWDVLAASVRPGSLDSSIEASSAVPNDFEKLLQKQPGIALVCFNGQAAAKLYARLVAPSLEKSSNAVEYKTLPSTSPAHATMSFEEKLRRWEIVRVAANNRRIK